MIAFSTDVRLKRGVPKAVLGLIIGTFLIHVVFKSSMDLGWMTLDQRWDIQAFNLANPDPFQWLLSLLSHGSYWHWFGNMLYLWLFGSILEDRLGSWQFLGLFIVTGACADILNITVVYGLCALEGVPIPPIRSLGASGAVSGIMGLAMFRFYKAHVRVWLDGIGFFPFLRWSIPIWFFCAWFFIKQIFGLFFSFSNVNHLAHIGGFLGGVIAGPLLGFKKQNYEEMLWDKAQELKEEGFYSLAAEELIAQLPRRPGDPVIHKDIGECLYQSRSLGRRSKTETRRLSLSHFLKAVDHYVHRGQLKEAVDLYAHLLDLFDRQGDPRNSPREDEDPRTEGFRRGNGGFGEPARKTCQAGKGIEGPLERGEPAGGPHRTHPALRRGRPAGPFPRPPVPGRRDGGQAEGLGFGGPVIRTSGAQGRREPDRKGFVVPGPRLDEDPPPKAALRPLSHQRATPHQHRPEPRMGGPGGEAEAMIRIHHEGTKAPRK
jgi:membrane associated rhomboid family serine protease